MNNAELIKALRYCGTVEPNNGCDGCPMKGVTNCVDLIDRDAADALETAEKRIAELEAQAEALKEESEAYKFGYLDGKTESDRQIEDLQTALTACRLRKDEARMPKEGEWIESNTRPRSAQFDCSVCHRTCYDIQPTRDKTWTKRCRYHYCPNCGCAMGGEKK